MATLKTRGQQIFASKAILALNFTGPFCKTKSPCNLERVLREGERLNKAQLTKRMMAARHLCSGAQSANNQTEPNTKYA